MDLAGARPHRPAPPRPAPRLSNPPASAEGGSQGPGEKSALAGRARGGTAGLAEGGGRAENVRPSPPCALCPGPGARLPSCWVGARGDLDIRTAMAPAASRLRVESELGSLPKRALAQYLLLLKLYPVLTKAVSRWAPTGKWGEKEGCRQGRLSCRGG